MSFTPEEIKIIEFGKANKKSKQDVEKALLKFRKSQPALIKETPKEKGVVERLGDTGTEMIDRVSGNLAGTGEYADKSSLNRGVNTVAAIGTGVVKGAVDLAPEPVRKGLDWIGDKVSKGFKSVTDWAADTDLIKGAAGNQVTREGGIVDYVPNDTSGLEDKLGIATGGGEIAGNILAAEGGVRTLKRGTDQAKKVYDATGNVLNTTKKNVGNVVSNTYNSIKPAIQGTKNIAKIITEEAKRVPNRVATNVAEKQAVQQTIEKLPTKTAKSAAQDGLDVADVNSIYKIPKTQKAPLKTLAKITKDFAEGKTKTNPIEVVGRPIVKRIKELESARGRVGQKLGEVANDLGNVTSKETFPIIFSSLKKVNGLSGLKVSKKGILDFKDTVLTTAETLADRKAIQSIFMDAIKSGTGKSKHLLRQELFEVLGGKKKSLANLTDTQERVYNSIRQGISDILESKNSRYKDLSNQYRKITQPLQDMRGYMKKVVGADDDILDMSAGLLARRLTSAAKSNPEIRNVLNAMDRATSVKGKTRLSVETLQDFYNILEKYYDVAPKTGFQAQVTQGVEKASGGAFNYLADKVKGFAGETPAVRQKALESILKEVLGD